MRPHARTPPIKLSKEFLLPCMRRQTAFGLGNKVAITLIAAKRKFPGRELGHLKDQALRKIYSLSMKHVNLSKRPGPRDGVNCTF